MITILLAGLCLNLSTLHFHSLSVFAGTDKNNVPLHIKDDLPVCFACQHLALGISSSQKSQVIATTFRKAGLFISIEADTDFKPSSVSNKSPPLL